MGLAYLIILYMNLPGIKIILKQAYGSSISYNPLYEFADMTILEQAFEDKTQFGDI